LVVTPSRQRELQVAAILAGTVLLISGCATLSPGEREAKRETQRMLVTAYDAGPKVKEMGVTSSGKKAKKGTIAADVRLFPYGTQMYVPDYGWGEAQDMGSAIRGNHVDVFFPKEKDAIAWGRKYLDVTVIRQAD
jgi:3D (Asp-Asp-Asp) domain-containing protein